MTRRSADQKALALVARAKDAWSQDAAPEPVPALAAGEPPPPSEQEFQQRLRLRLTEAIKEVRVWRQPTGRIQTNKKTTVECAPVGAADLTGIVSPEGWRLEIEVKGWQTLTTEDQLNWALRTAERGGIYVMTRYDAKLSLDANLDVAVESIRGALAYRRRKAADAQREATIVTLEELERAWFVDVDNRPDRSVVALRDAVRCLRTMTAG